MMEDCILGYIEPHTCEEKKKKLARPEMAVCC